MLYFWQMAAAGYASIVVLSAPFGFYGLFSKGKRPQNVIWEELPRVLSVTTVESVSDISFMPRHLPHGGREQIFIPPKTRLLHF